MYVCWHILWLCIRLEEGNHHPSYNYNSTWLDTRTHTHTQRHKDKDNGKERSKFKFKRSWWNFSYLQHLLNEEVKMNNRSTQEKNNNTKVSKDRTSCPDWKLIYIMSINILICSKIWSFQGIIMIHKYLQELCLICDRWI